MSSIEKVAQDALGEADFQGMGMPEMISLRRAVTVGETAMPAVASWTCEILAHSGELARLREEWAQLALRAGRDTQLFQSPAWGSAWIDAFGDGEGRRCTPLVVVVRDARNNPVLIWPLMRVRYPIGLTIITWLTDPYGQYGDVITTLRGTVLEEALETALDAIARQGADLVRLKFVREDALIAPFLRRRFRHTGETYGAPWLDLSPYATPEDLERRYTRTQRRRRRKIHNRLERHLGTEPTFRRITGLAEIRAAVTELLEHKRAWLRERGLVSRALFHDRAGDFLYHLAERMAADPEGPEFVLTAIEGAGRQLSWELGFRWKGRHYAYITAQAPDVRHLSIGRLHMYFSQAQAVADGMQVFDLLVPAAPHKKSWSSDVAPVRNHFLPLTLRGRLLGQAYLCHLRPMLREIYHRLPAGVRSFLHLSDIHEYDTEDAHDLSRATPTIG